MGIENAAVNPLQNSSSNASSSKQQPLIDPSLLHSLEWRLIGPFRGGRVVAVAGDPAHPLVFYFGSTGGGVWKTTDGGLIWENVSDGFFKRASVGAIVVSNSDPNVVYVGMGETTIRGNVSHGDGVYKSTDGGRTWTHLGLENTRNIAKICIHPQNPDLVYVAAMGHAHGPNPERGVYRSSDGGKTWQHILFKSDRSGANDLTLDPNNPRIVYVTFWEAERKPYTLISGGEGCSIFKSLDGGETWAELTRNPGLPKGILGKIGLAVSPAKENRVWAIIDAEDGAIFLSDDGGENWERRSEDRNLRARPWYYQHMYADPQDPETIWVLNVQAWKSVDGGRTFFEVYIPHGDHHDLWIDPQNPQRLIQGNDGGACISFNGGNSWSTIYNQPTAEFYHVTTDNQVPYRVYAAQQDNTTISLPSRSNLAGISQSDSYEVGGGESGYIAVRPDNPNIVFAGNYHGYLTRYDHYSRQERNITVWPEAATGWGAKDVKYRFQWTFPTVLSPHDPNVLYVAGNHVFRSTNEGSSWEIISPDLTRNDITKLEPSGGPVTRDNTGTEFYCTIFAFAESPINKGVFWAGSDDGLIHVSQDDGKNWRNVTPTDLPEWSLISIIEPSPHDPAVAYIAANRYKWDDFQPYLYRTDDYGATWTKITTGIAENEFTRVIREDPIRRGLLYAGTEAGIYVSFDDGGYWQSLRLNLPVVPIHDLVVKDTDLIVATHGRSLWILDDLTPLRFISQELQNATMYLFKPRPTVRFMTSWGYSHPSGPGTFYRMTGDRMITARRQRKPGGGMVDRNMDAGENPPDGVIVYYFLKQKPEAEVKLTFRTIQGEEIKSFTSEADRDQTLNMAVDPTDEEEEKEKRDPSVPKEAGTNRFIWNMCFPDPKKIDGYVASEAVMAGPAAAPGSYQVELKIGDQTLTEVFEIQKDPRVQASQKDLDAQFELLLRVRSKLSETHDAINMLRNIRQQVEDWVRRSRERQDHEAIVASALSIKEKLVPIEYELTQSKAKTRQDTMNWPVKLNGKLAWLAAVISSAQAAPTRQSYELFEDLVQRIDMQLQRLNELINTDVAAFNQLMSESGVPAIIPISTIPVKR
ncbi:MAG: WD40/YVTN/BNR-like repeat-containing protein [Ktedonobacteraceae bacterium]